MHCPRVPYDEITRLSAHLAQLASALLEPVYLRLLEAEPITRTPCRAVLDIMCSKELFVQSVRARVHQQSAVVRSVWGQVQDSLRTLETAPFRRLIDVWPR